LPGTVNVQLQASGGTLVVLPNAFEYVGPVYSAGVDSDSDGLADVDEVAGYPIKVDMLGFGLHPDHMIEFSVTSDPFDPDSDDDGLDDAEEFFARTNPQDKDTDGDGLWDSEEARRWLTSPVRLRPLRRARALHSRAAGDGPRRAG